MSRAASFTVDSHQLRSMFADLTGKEFRKSEREALRKSASVLVREARKQLKQRVKKTTTWHTGKGGKRYRLSSGIASKVAKDGKSAKVHIMKDFRLKFFEMGTGDRYVTRRGTTALKKKAFRGRIEKGKYSFFLRAQQASREKVFGEMGMRVAEAVKKISDKKRT